MENSQAHFDTLAIHAGQQPDPLTGAVIPPIYQTSTFTLPNPDEPTSGYVYSRVGNPTRTALESVLAALEGGKHALAFSSGMGAIDCVARLLVPGDHVIVGNDVYGGTYRLFAEIIPRYGIAVTWIDMTDVESIRAAVTPKTRLLWLETPTNPMLTLFDIQAISAVMPEGALIGVDNTFASPALQRPLMLGADIVMHSTTKYLGGHSDIIGGALIVNDDALFTQLQEMQNATGAVPAPLDCFLTMRGIKTLSVRMERHCQNALHIARYLDDHPAVEKVIYPGLESHPQHELAKRQMRGFGGMITLKLPSTEAARQFVMKTKLFVFAVSLGGVESLVEYPYTLTHASTQGTEMAADPSVVRLSVGIEHVDDLIADLRQALES